MKSKNIYFLTLVFGLGLLVIPGMQAMELLALDAEKSATQQTRAVPPNSKTEFVGGLPLSKVKIYGDNFQVVDSEQRQIQIRREQRARKRAKMSQQQKKELDLSLWHLVGTYPSSRKNNANVFKIKQTQALAQIQKTLKDGADPDCLENDPNIYNHSHFPGKDYDLLAVLISAGLDLSKRTSNGLTLLHQISSHPEKVKLLIKNKADVNAVDSEDREPIDCAKPFSNHDGIKLLLDAKACPDFDIEDNYSKYDSILIRYGGYPKISSSTIEDVENRFNIAHQQIHAVAGSAITPHFPPVISDLILGYYAPTFGAAYAQAVKRQKEELDFIPNLILEYCEPRFGDTFAQWERYSKELGQVRAALSERINNQTAAHPPASATPSSSTPTPDVPALDEDENDRDIQIRENHQPARDLLATENPSSLQYNPSSRSTNSSSSMGSASTTSSTTTTTSSDSSKSSNLTMSTKTSSASSDSNYSGSSTSLTREQGTPPRPEFNEHKNNQKK